MSRPSSSVALTLLAVAALAACSKPAEPPAPAAQAEKPAAAAQPQSDRVRPVRLGDFTALSLSDGGLELPNDNQVFGVGLKPEDVAAVLTAAGLPTDKLSLAVHPLLVKTADRVLLFDTGAGALFGETTGKLGASLAEAGVDPATVTDIFISHSHGDHVGGLVNAQGGSTFANARIHLSAAEWAHMQSQQPYKPLVAAIQTQVETFTPGAELVPGVVTAVEIKGHTPGHSGYRITSGGDTLLYVGDTVHHYVVSVRKPEWAISFDGDQVTGAASRAALLAQLADSGERVFAVHFPFPGSGRVEKRPEGFTWVAD